MAFISETKSGKWRAEICVNYKRKVKTFPAKHEADTWAEFNERQLSESNSLRIEMTRRLLKASSALDILKSRVINPNVPGVYILMENDIVCYVGKSTNMLTRLASHSTKGRRFTHFITIPEPDVSKLDELERYYIEMLQPLENRDIIKPIIRR
ncbi:MAG TPA: GIY-YIG nuclease family protein [Methylovorus sp.]|nr:GIY-YIG nuclease family protein [Methylovorus sp.]